jgi:serine/threonine protein kinase
VHQWLSTRRKPGGSASILMRMWLKDGSADYIAPEQARSAHTADIRADIYSLGCTLYFLLTAQVPFPGEGVLKKFLKHLREEPKPVERLRSDVPAEVTTVLRKMIAKNPDERYQTPAEVAAVLASLLDMGCWTSLQEVESDLSSLKESSSGTDPGGDTIPSIWADMAQASEETAASASPPPVRTTFIAQRWLLCGVVCGCLALLGMVALIFVIL